MAAELVISLASVGDFVAFRDGAKQIAASHGLSEQLIWPQERLLSGDEFALSHKPLIEGPLTIDSVACRPLSTIRNSLVVVELDTPLFIPRYLAPGAKEPFLVPDFAWQRWTEEQRAWLASECQEVPPQELDAVSANGCEIVRALVDYENVTIISEAFEYVSPNFGEPAASRSALAGALEDINLLNRELSAECGALILHAHTGMAFEGAQVLDTDCRKLGPKAARLLIAELQLTLTDGGGMDVFTS